MLRDGMPDDRPGTGAPGPGARRACWPARARCDAALRLVREQVAERPRSAGPGELAGRARGRRHACRRRSTTPPAAWPMRCWGIAEALHQERGGARAVRLRPPRAVPEAGPGRGDAADRRHHVAEQDNLDAAIDAYEAIDDDSPLSFAGKLRIARALHELDRKEQAFELLEGLAAAEPERIRGAGAAGRPCCAATRTMRAPRAPTAAPIERLGTPEREDWTLFYARGIAYERTKRWPEAEADFLQRPRARAGAALRAQLSRLQLGRHGHAPGPRRKRHAGPRGRVAAERRLHRRQRGLGALSAGRVPAGGRAASSARSSSSRAIR